MIRVLRGDDSEWFYDKLLGSIDRFTSQHSVDLWTEVQLRSIARFIAFMARHDRAAQLFPSEGNPWEEALVERWGTYSPESRS